jgi:dTDP-4-amino-4,6-dideoxygalactose transaminase
MDFIDLKTQYQRVRESMNRRMQAVLDHGQFILGAEAQELERKLAEYVGVKCAYHRAAWISSISRLNTSACANP